MSLAENDDLMIVVRTRLEADEEASAQRISAQLPSIAAKINEKSSIKVGVTLDERNTDRLQNSISQQLSRIHVDPVNIGIKVTGDAKKMLREAMAGSGIDESSELMKSMTKNLTGMDVQVGKIHAQWVKVGRQKERLLQLDIYGRDALGKEVLLMQQYAQNGRKVDEQVKDVTLNIDKLNRQSEQAARKEQRDNENRLNYIRAQSDALEKLKAQYLSPKDGLHGENLESAESQYAKISARLDELRAKNGALTDEEKRGIDGVIAEMQREIQTMKQVESVEESAARKSKSENDARVASLTTLSSKLDAVQKKYQGLTGVKGVQGEGHLSELNRKYQEIFDTITRLQGANGALSQTQRAEIDAQIKELDRLSDQYYRVEHVATQLRTKNVWEVNSDYANELDVYAKKLQTSGLLTKDFEERIASLRNQLSTAFDSKSLTDFADQFDRLKGAVGSFKAGQELEAKIARINSEMAVMPSQIDSVDARFRNLINPTETLKANIERLRQLSAQVNNEQDANRKVEAYNRLKQTLALVNSEMAALTSMQNTGLRDEKLTANLEKAKADLLTVGRTWSALKADKGLNLQFEQLLANLDRVNNAGDLSKWRAEFNAFKSEVKAAGKNVQSLGDILKNNLGKVLQWVSATTLLFRAIRYLRQGIQTVVDLNTAMIDLRKVTKATGEEYEAFYRQSNETAKQLNLTTQEVISQTANFARLGYAIDDASKLAQNAAIFKMVSPGMSQETAVDGLISIVKAYGIEVEDTMDGIISKINEVGKQNCPAA